MIDIDTINDRTSWLAYRADWRRRYKEVSEDIRTTKREMARHRYLRRELGADGVAHTHAADGMQSGLLRKHKHAGAMMRELDAAKKHKTNLMANADKSLAA